MSYGTEPQALSLEGSLLRLLLLSQLLKCPAFVLFITENIGFLIVACVILKM